MGMFDFLKKKELETIKRQEEQIKQLTAEKMVLEARLKVLEKYGHIIDLEEQSKRILQEQEERRKEHEATIEDYKQKIAELAAQYQEGHETYQRLKEEIQIYKDTLDVAEHGVYEPHFDFDTSAQYELEMTGVYDELRRAISSGEAAKGGEYITWNGSEKKGQEMVGRIKKMMLRTFNGECDNFIHDVDWNNVYKMESRIRSSYEAVNKAYREQGIYITPAYRDLKIKQLRLAYEYSRKKHEEREEQRAIKEQMREEEKARREIEAALRKAEKEEETYQKALEKARAEIEGKEGAKQEKLQAKIDELEKRLAESESNRERALSMAQQTKRGHVYVISNIGSFGENVYKIGMTRRLDPMDRVKELGDASVPFSFDVHAIIFSEDAPSLEAKLHRRFDHRRVNRINLRKEFFSVTLDEIQAVVHEENAEIEFTRIAEAKDYRETLAMLRAEERAEEANQEAEEEDTFPAALFAS